MPYDLKETNIDKLLEQKKILSVEGNKIWSASIFPLSKKVSALNQLDKDHQITLIDDELFVGYTVLDKTQQTVLINNNTGRKCATSLC